jgi:hypothetical protein
MTTVGRRFMRVRSRRVAPILAVTLGLVAMGASLANVPPAIALHQTGPGGPVAAGLVLLATEVLALTSQVAVAAATLAAATLAAAALFNPLRRRVQRRVDRHFNRARYDADNTVAAFAARVQDAADPGEVRSDLIGTVNNALEPAQLSLWLTGVPR